MDGDPDPGEVVWTWVAFEEDPEQGKDRPIVVIGRRGSKLVGVPLTSKQHDNEAQVAVGTGDWDPKLRPSFARIWRMLDIEPKNMRREGPRGLLHNRRRSEGTSPTTRPVVSQLRQTNRTSACFSVPSPTTVAPP